MIFGISPPLVLMYHAIVPRDLPGGPSSHTFLTSIGAVYQDDFERQLIAVRRRFQLIHPEEYAELLIRGKSPPLGSVIVTVDDGFQNLLDFALPVAESLGIPLLAFVSTGHLDGGPWLWFTRTAAVRLSGGADLSVLHTGLKRQSLSAIEASLRSAGVPPDMRNDPLCRTLFGGASSEDLQQACRRGHLVLGGHTVHHPNLSCETSKICASEIIENQARLQAIAGTRIRLFAYPSGDFTREAARIVREIGFDAAFAINPPGEPLENDLRRYHVPRVGVYRPGRLRFWLKCSGVDYWRWKLGLIK